jgi:bifunctional DNA-binding transcriptional regulator/antitoxin component of YhaV-PrlF toxin-antitoxin module
MNEDSNEIIFEPEYEEIKSFHKMADLKIDTAFRVGLPKMLRELIEVKKGDSIRIGFNAQGDIVIKK